MTKRMRKFSRASTATVSHRPRLVELVFHAHSSDLLAWFTLGFCIWRKSCLSLKRKSNGEVHGSPWVVLAGVEVVPIFQPNRTDDRFPAEPGAHREQDFIEGIV